MASSNHDQASSKSCCCTHNPSGGHYKSVLGLISSHALPLLTAGGLVATAVVAIVKLTKAVNKERRRRYSFATLRSPLDYEKHAKEFGNPLGAMYYGYVCAVGETLQACREEFSKLKLMPRSMKGIDADTRIRYFGREVSAPLIIAPTALHNLADPEGEVATARGAGQGGVVYCYNYFLSSQRIEDVAKQPGEKWLHLYLFEERELVEYAIEDALENFKGVFSAIIVTLDHPHNRVRDTVVPYFRRMWLSAIPTKLNAPYMPNLARASKLSRAPTAFEVLFSNPDISKTIQGTNDATLTWNDLQWLKEKIRGRVPLVGKGLLDPRDALEAVKHGADAVVVSNHGGRQVDGAIPAIQALPAVIAALRESHPDVKVFCDTGVRTSTDVVRIMALGGAGALIGRPPLFALMSGGSDSLAKMLIQWREDIRDDMKCLGWERWDARPEGVLAQNK